MFQFVVKLLLLFKLYLMFHRKLNPHTNKQPVKIMWRILLSMNQTINNRINMDTKRHRLENHTFILLKIDHRSISIYLIRHCKQNTQNQFKIISNRVLSIVRHSYDKPAYHQYQYHHHCLQSFMNQAIPSPPFRMCHQLL